MNDKFRIVIAEDNPADVIVVRLALKQVLTDFELKVFGDGQRMLKYVDELQRGGVPSPDIMLLDLNMPRVGGLEVMQRLRSSTCVSTPVVIITSSSRPKDREQALALGAAHYFLKSDNFDEFLKIGEVVSEILN